MHNPPHVTIRKLVLSLLLILSFHVVSAQSALQIEMPEEDTENFINPILSGFYPDPSVTRVGDDFYLVHSTFSYFPGVPLFHSKDLVNWKQLGHILDRPEQLNVEGLPVSQGVFAPSIQYHEGIFYMLTTLVGKGGNFVVTTEDPAGDWSNPVWLPEVHGIDPSLFFDTDGKTYVVYNSDAPNNEPLYSGHRTIRMIELDLKTLKTIGDNRILVNGGVNIDEKPVWIEGPHIFIKDGFYYLSAAEGGTSVNHSQVIFRTERIEDDFVPWDKNPILTARNLDPNRKDPIAATGHAELVSTPDGEWWAIFLATRPYDLKDSYNLGREAFLTPVTWTEDGWPIINPDHEEVRYSYPRPNLASGRENLDFPKTGEFTITDNFDYDKLPDYWFFLRVPKDDWYTLNKDQGNITLKLRPETVGGMGNPSFITRRQQHNYGEAETYMDFTPKSQNEKAGLLFFQNDTHHLFLGKSLDQEGNVTVNLFQSNDSGELDLLKSKNLPNDTGGIYFKGTFEKALYKFYFKTDEASDWEFLHEFTEGEYLSTRVAGGFVGVTIGMYATSSGNDSDNEAKFDYFRYQGKKL